MTSCTIIISHFQSLPFLRAAIRQIKKFKHPEVEQHIIVADQSGSEYYSQYDVEALRSELDNSPDITFINTLPLYSGFGIDWIMRYMNIKTEYIAQFHVDCLPIHPNYLYLCIKLIEENNFSFVGQLQFINGKENLASIYPSHPFFAMAQCFNVARVETYREMSLEAGFTRFHNRVESQLEFKNHDWDNWALPYYWSRGSDDDVVAFHWEDKYKQHDKLGLAISGFCEPSWGRIIENLVFHFCSCREAQGVMSAMPELYQHYTRKINENYSDELIEEMVQMAKKNKPNGSEILSRNYWNGKLKQSFPPTEALNKRIEELKQQ